MNPMIPVNPALKGLQSVLHDPSQPGGMNSVEALKRAILALKSGDVNGASNILSSFQQDARRSTDFVAKQGGDSGDNTFTRLINSLHGGS